MLLNIAWVICLIFTSSSALKLVPMFGDGSGILIATVNGTDGGICPDDFTLREASVVCRQLGKGFGKFLRPMRFDVEKIPSEKHVLRMKGCRGSEDHIERCMILRDWKGVPCSSTETMGVRCTESLPDIKPDIDLTEITSYVMQAPLYTIRCAFEENCLGASANESFFNATTEQLASRFRVLLRFSSVIMNVGTAPFLPFQEKDEWTYHECHRHYHSMDDFTKYILLNDTGSQMAFGHKSSFCLEDSVCDTGVPKYFRCGRTPTNRGNQGISPGCRDYYFHDYDCQWIDITDLKPGRYKFQMAINPNYLVGELDYGNNGVECTLDYFPPDYGSLTWCTYRHPMELNL